MTTITEPNPRRWRQFTENPVTIKELRSRMRGRKAFVVLAVYLAVMSGIIAITYLSYTASASGRYGSDTRDAGKIVLSIVVGVETFLAMFMAPSFTAGAISGEKERQTFDLLRTTLLPARWFVTGKLLSALSYVFLLIFASLPLQSIAFMLGGVSWVEMIISQLLIVVAAITYALFGLLCSSLMKSTLTASVLTFGGILFFTMGLPSLTILGVALMSPFMYGISSSWMFEAALSLGGILMAAVNLPATLITSAVFLIEEGSIFYITQHSYGGGSSHSFLLPSPWIPFILIHLAASLLMYSITVRRVRRISNK